MGAGGLSDSVFDRALELIATDPNVQRALLDRTHRQTVKEQDGKLLVNSYQDVEPHLEYCAKVRRAEWDSRGQFGKRPFFHRVMAPPVNVIYAVADRLGLKRSQIFDPEHSKRIWAELKRPEFKLFRTTNDKHIG